MSINKVIISGNLTRDPDIKQTSGGTQVMQLGVAVNDRRKNAQGEWEDKPNYVDCTLFGKRVDWLSRELHRGTKVAICGKLDYQSWQDKEGNNRSKLAVIAEDVEVMSKGARSGSGDGAASGGNQAAYSQNDIYDQDIPF